LDDRYPSTYDHQSAHLDYPYPDAVRDLSRGLPLVKWFLAIPHYVVLFCLDIAAVVVVIVAGAPSCSPVGARRGMFDFVQGRRSQAGRRRVPILGMCAVEDDDPGRESFAPGPADPGHSRRLREAGAEEQVTSLTAGLPAAGMFSLFQRSAGSRFRFGYEPDASPAAPWGWEDLY
jgi:hypothetical protein